LQFESEREKDFYFFQSFHIFSGAPISFTGSSVEKGTLKHNKFNNLIFHYIIHNLEPTLPGAGKGVGKDFI
jgi:hypothetical protein